MPTRKEIMDILNIYSYAELPDDYFNALYEYHNKKTLALKKENVVLAFINHIFHINKKKPISKLSEFVNVQRDDLLFYEIPKDIRNDIKKEFDITMKVKDADEEDYASLYLKNMIKLLPKYDFLFSKKEIVVLVDGVKKKKPTMIYTVSTKDDF